MRKGGNYKESLRYYQKAAELNPNNYIAFGNIGSIFKRLKRYNEAIEAFSRVLEIDPTEQKAIDNIADSYYYLNDFVNCKRYIDKFEALIPTLDANIMSERMKRSIEKSRRNFAMYKKAITDKEAL